MSLTDPSTSWSRGALETVERCPACGSARRDAREYARHDDGGVMPDVWRMVRCGDCRSLYLDPRPDDESLPCAYREYYTHQAERIDIPEEGAGGLAWSLIHGYLNWRFGMQRAPASRLGALVFSALEPLRLKLDYYGRHLARGLFPQPGRLLDIGCGNGAFLVRAREMGWGVSGCEPDPKAVAACHAQGLDVIQGNVFSPALDGELFDVVTISHVLEHVVDPQALLKRAYVLLRPGGVLWVALPNPGSLGLRIFGAAWRGLHVPFHLCIPSQSQLRKMAESANFASIKMLRRGAHGRSLGKDSMAIANREKIATPSDYVTALFFILSCLLATFTPRRAEETVMVARKPEVSDVG